MKASEWKRVVRPLLPATEPWEFRGSLAYRRPVDRVLFGVLGEGSAFDKGVYVWGVVMPLFVPTDNVNLSWSGRIGGRKFHSHDDQALAAAISEAMLGLGDDVHALDQMISRGSRIAGNRQVDEVVAYCHVLRGELDRAKPALASAGTGAVASPWQRTVVERSQLIAQLLEDGPPGAIRQLDQWCTETAGALGLRRSPDPRGPERSGPAYSR